MGRWGIRFKALIIVGLGLCALTGAGAAEAGVGAWPESVGLTRGDHHCRSGHLPIGLVSTECDFSFYRAGDSPTHPLLVDWRELRLDPVNGACLTELSGFVGYKGGRILARAPFAQLPGPRVRTQLRIRSRSDRFLGRLRGYASRPVGKLTTSLDRRPAGDRLHWRLRLRRTPKTIRVAIGVAARAPTDDGLVYQFEGGDVGTGRCPSRNGTDRAGTTTARYRLPVQRRAVRVP